MNTYNRPKPLQNTITQNNQIQQPRKRNKRPLNRNRGRRNQQRGTRRPNQQRSYRQNIPNNNYNYFSYPQIRREMQQTLKMLNNMALNKVNSNAISQNPRLEIRYDKLYTAYDMYRLNKFYPLYKTPLATILYPVYNEWTVNVANSAQWDDCLLIWLPYTYPYMDPTYRVTINNAQIPPTIISPLIRSARNAQQNARDNIWFDSNRVQITGQQRLIAATLKLSNVTSMLDKAGTYTAYKCLSDPVFPIITANGWQNERVPQIITDYINTIAADSSLTPTKLLGTASQRLTINEFNTMPGNDQFQGASEYQGAKLVNGDTWIVRPENPEHHFNFIGTNVYYKISIPPLSGAQSYKIQTWQVFEISPDNNTFSPLATIHRNTADYNVFSRMQGSFPFTTTD